MIPLSGGMPNRVKKIEEKAITKRTGWQGFFGGDVESKMEFDILHRNRFNELHKMILALPSQIIINRKALHYLWVYREFVAELAYDSGRVNRFLSDDLRIQAFLWTLDVPDLFVRVWLWWKKNAEYFYPYLDPKLKP